jgi:hypothetical protein
MCKLSQLFIALVLLLNLLPAAAEVSGAVTEYGYYNMTAEPKRYRNISATSGYVKEGGEPELVEKTDRIPLQLNRLFGFKFRISGFDDKRTVQLQLVVSHPEITRPNGSTSTGYTYPLVFDVQDGVIVNESGYSIDNQYEMVEGEWKFEYWYNKQKLVSQTFTTFMEQNADEAQPDAITSNNVDAGEGEATEANQDAAEATSTELIKSEQNPNQEKPEDNKAGSS